MVSWGTCDREGKGVKEMAMTEGSIGCTVAVGTRTVVEYEEGLRFSYVCKALGMRREETGETGEVGNGGRKRWREKGGISRKVGRGRGDSSLFTFQF